MNQQASEQAATQPKVHHLDEMALEFALRRDAQKMKYSTLVETERRAVMELLARMQKALVQRQSEKDGGPHSKEANAHATGFLISGARGTGKTTVLLSARYAFEDSRKFFEDNNQYKKDIEEIEKIHSYIRWLDPFDMQQLPTNANLLTMLLVRLRDGLTGESTSRVGTNRTPGDVLVNEADEAWRKLYSLIHSATVMWEPISEQDAIRRASVQIDVAQTYASFVRDFGEAIEKAARYKAPAANGRSPVLVLPIDNADRSAEHVYSILKLVQMARCPHLWYVLAGNLSDLDVFVERSFRDELKVSDLAASEGGIVEKMTGIARRQAASTVRTVLPPAHRISIETVEPADALRFKNEQEDHEQKDQLSVLLQGIRVVEDPRPQDPKDKEQKKWPKDQPTHLLHYFVLDEFLHEDAKGILMPDKSSPSVLSYAGESALRLPMRNLVDLWQNAKFRQTKGDVQDKPENSDREAAVTLVHDVLDNLIAESELPQWACACLREQVIFRDASNKICLDLSKNPIHWDAVFRTRNQFRIPPSSKGNAYSERIRSYLKLNDFFGFRLELHWEGQKEVLPDLVAGWFMILYDLLKRKAGPRINDSRAVPTDVKNLQLVETLHEALVWGSLHKERDPKDQMTDGNNRCAEVVLRFHWNAPVFESFFDYALLGAQWRAFLDGVVGRKRRVSDKPYDVERFVQYLLAVWVNNICSVANVENRCPLWGSVLSAPNERNEREVLAVDGGGFEAHVRQVSNAVGKLYDDVLTRPWDAAGRFASILKWLEVDFVLLGAPEYLGPAAPIKSIWNASLVRRQHEEKREDEEKKNGQEEPGEMEEELRKLFKRWNESWNSLGANRARRVRQAFEYSILHEPLREYLAGSTHHQRDVWSWSATLEGCCNWFEVLNGLFDKGTWARKLTPEPRFMPDAWWPLPVAQDRSAITVPELVAWARQTSSEAPAAHPTQEQRHNGQ